MCGVIGIIGKEPVAQRLAIAADRLQNRGEHSTGVVTYDGSFFFHHADLGPANFVFHQYDISRLKGNVGIAHTRYATTGGGDREKLRRNMQPVLSDRPSLALCANGDLVNLDTQRARLRDKGFSFQTEVDAKVIQNTMIDACFAKNLHRCRTTEEYIAGLFDALPDVHRSLVGAYSVLAILEKGLLAFRDPRGIRPLCMAERRIEDDIFPHKEYCFSSESSVLNYFGDYHHIEELRPGEAVFIDRETLDVHRQQVAPGRSAFCFFEFTYFARPDSKFKNRVVEAARKDLGSVLAVEYAHLKNRLDVVTGVPSTGLSAAHSLAQAFGVPYENAIIKVGLKRSFQETSQEKRERAIDDKFIFIKEFIEGKRVGVVDDSNVRGTTARKIVKRIFDLGAKEVHLFFFTPKVIGPCFYGIDTPDEGKLIAWNRSDAEIREMVGATTINYISIEGLIKGLQLPADELCLACLTREYPTAVDEAKTRLTLRNREREAESNG